MRVILLNLTSLAVLLQLVASQTEEKGPYNIVLRQISGCDGSDIAKSSSIRPKVSRNIESKFPRITSVFIDNPLTNNDSIHLSVAAWADGEWSENYYNKSVPNICQFIVNSFRIYSERTLQMKKPENCEIPAGSYDVEELIEEMPQVFPELTYHQFKVDVTTETGNSVSGCVRLFLDTTHRSLTP